ncbi:MAG: hypothetical protein KJP07_15545, partial [Desulfatitalea sp.]|nr:hypothetical protein [Desulfatitalea sp.]
VLRRMARVQGRHRELVRLADGIVLELAGLDESLFALPGVIDFQAAVFRAGGSDALVITLWTHEDPGLATGQAAAAVTAMPAVRAAMANGALRLAPVAVHPAGRHIAAGVKRRIDDRRIDDQSVYA